MAYCTQADLIRRYGELELIQLTDRDGMFGALDADVLEAAISDAGEEIDAYLRDGGYALPLADPPHVLVRRACQLARYYLYDAARPEPVADDYQEALDWLERVATGKVNLSVGGDGIPTAPLAIAAGSRAQIYTDDLLAKYSL